MATEAQPLVGYQIQFHDGVMPPEAYGGLYNYRFGSNGVFVLGKREGLEVCFPIAECEIRGLEPVETFARLTYPKVPANYLASMLDLSTSNCTDGRKRETLFHLWWLETEHRWRLDRPAQHATGGSVKPLEDGPGSSYDLALIEVHSHHEMDAFFSGDDDADEQGFRVYGVLGNIFTDPKFRVRVGCYGQFFDVPAAAFFEIPAGIKGFDPEAEDWEEVAEELLA